MNAHNGFRDSAFFRFLAALSPERRGSAFGLRISGPLPLRPSPHADFRAALVMCLGVLVAGLSCVWGQGQASGQAPRSSASISSAATSEDRDADKQNMLVIYKALKTYEKEHGKLPDWLSDLVPKYIQDTNVLVSPIFRRSGKEELYGNEDPHITPIFTSLAPNLFLKSSAAPFPISLPARP